MNASHTEVLIIGAGPTGLFVAGELARHGVKARIIDKCPVPHAQTRATGVQPASLEVFTRSGIVDPFLAEGVPVEGVRILDANWKEALFFTVRRRTRHIHTPARCRNGAPRRFFSRTWKVLAFTSSAA